MILFVCALAHAQSEPAPVPAPSTEDELAQAKLLYTNGAALYEEGQYPAAIQAFQEAYALSKNPKLLLNIANAFERLNELQKAYETLNQYRIYAGSEETETISRRLRTLEARMDEQRSAAAAAAPVVSPAPVPAPAAATPSEAVTTVPNRARWVTVGIGAATALGFGGVAAFTYSAGRGEVDLGDQDAYERIRPLNNVSIGLAAVGVGVGVVGLALPATRTLPATTVSFSPRNVTIAARF